MHEIKKDKNNFQILDPKFDLQEISNEKTELNRRQVSTNMSNIYELRELSHFILSYKDIRAIKEGPQGIRVDGRNWTRH